MEFCGEKYDNINRSPECMHKSEGKEPEPLLEDVQSEEQEVTRLCRYINGTTLN